MRLVWVVVNSRIDLNVDMARSKYDILAKKQVAQRALQVHSRVLKLEGRVTRIFTKMGCKFPDRIDYMVRGKKAVIYKK